MTPLVNEITQCYLPPDRGDRPAFTPTGQVGTRFIDPVRMKSWVGLVGWLHTNSDITFHKNFLPWNISWHISWNIYEIFMKYLKISRFFSGFTLIRLTFFYTSNITFHSFMHTAVQLPKPICRPTCLVCLLKSFHTIDIDIFAGWRTMQAVLCIVYCNKVSKPVTGKYLLLCMMHELNYVSFTNLIYFNHVFKSFKSLNIEN